MPQTRDFFSDLGVELKREEGGKLFPVTDQAATVLNALLSAIKDSGVELMHPARIQHLEKTDQGFIARSADLQIGTSQVILCTGGYSLPKTGSDRGYNYAEVTAGGVPLTELNLKTMASRNCEGLFLAGEICDVDGRIGGYNFQWAWSSGYIAGVSALNGR